MSEPKECAGKHDRATAWPDSDSDALTASLADTPAQRLAWLEEMIELAHATGALPRPAEDEQRGQSGA